MKRFAMIIGLFFFIGVFANGCDKGEQPPEPSVKDAAKTEMEVPSETLEGVDEKAEEVVEETAQDVKEAAETVKEEAVESMEEVKEKTEEIVETSKKEADDASQGTEEQVKGLLDQ